MSRSVYRPPQPELSFLSPLFDPLFALSTDDLPVPVPNAPIRDTILQCSSFLDPSDPLYRPPPPERPTSIKRSEGGQNVPTLLEPRDVTKADETTSQTPLTAAILPNTAISHTLSANHKLLSIVHESDSKIMINSNGSQFKLSDRFCHSIRFKPANFALAPPLLASVSSPTYPATNVGGIISIGNEMPGITNHPGINSHESNDENGVQDADLIHAPSSVLYNSLKHKTVVSVALRGRMPHPRISQAIYDANIQSGRDCGNGLNEDHPTDTMSSTSILHEVDPCLSWLAVRGVCSVLRGTVLAMDNQHNLVMGNVIERAWQRVPVPLSTSSPSSSSSSSPSDFSSNLSCSLPHDPNFVIKQGEPLSQRGTKKVETGEGACFIESRTSKLSAIVGGVGGESKDNVKLSVKRRREEEPIQGGRENRRRVEQIMTEGPLLREHHARKKRRVVRTKVVKRLVKVKRSQSQVLPTGLPWTDPAFDDSGSEDESVEEEIEEMIEEEVEVTDESDDDCNAANYNGINDEDDDDDDEAKGLKVYNLSNETGYDNVRTLGSISRGDIDLASRLKRRFQEKQRARTHLEQSVGQAQTGLNVFGEDIEGNNHVDDRVRREDIPRNVGKTEEKRGTLTSQSSVRTMREGDEQEERGGEGGKGNTVIIGVYECSNKKSVCDNRQQNRQGRHKNIDASSSDEDDWVGSESEHTLVDSWDDMERQGQGHIMRNMRYPSRTCQAISSPIPSDALIIGKAPSYLFELNPGTTLSRTDPIGRSNDDLNRGEQGPKGSKGQIRDPDKKREIKGYMYEWRWVVRRRVLPMIFVKGERIVVATSGDLRAGVDDGREPLRHQRQKVIIDRGGRGGGGGAHYRNVGERGKGSTSKNKYHD